MKINRIDYGFFARVKRNPTYRANRARDFFSEDSGFCVLQVKAEGHRDLVTVIGSAPTVSAGEWLTAEGDWVIDKKHRRQLKSSHFQTYAAKHS